MPTGVVLTGSGDDRSFAAFPEATKKINSLFHFETFKDDLLCSKTGNNAFIFVKKNYPPYKRLRFRKHVFNLLQRVGYGKPFKYQELATPEFEPYVQTIWRNTPQIVPNANTNVAFIVMLQTSTTVKGEVMPFNFGPPLKLSDPVKDALAAAPADILKERDQINKRILAIQPLDNQGQYTIMKDPPVEAGLKLVRQAIENFSGYYEQENSELNNKVDALLTDPMWNDTKARRKIKDMRELKAKIPAAFNLILNIRKEEMSYYGQVPTDEETLALGEASLTHQYVLQLLVSADGKQVAVNLPL